MKKSKLTPFVLVMMIIAGLLLAGCAREREAEPTEPATTNDAGSVQSEQPGSQPQPLNPQPGSPIAPAGEPTTMAIATATPTPVASTGETTTESAATPETAEATATPVTSQSGAESTETSTGGERIHVVQPGQNLFRIALQYGLEVDALARYNGITNPELIYVGQKIKIPGGGSANGAYIVQQGDTLLSIAVKFNTTTEAIMAANNLSDANLIYVGQELNVP